MTDDLLIIHTVNELYFKREDGNDDVYFMTPKHSYNEIGAGTTPENFIEGFFHKHGGGHKPNNFEDYIKNTLRHNLYNDNVQIMRWTPLSRSFGVGMALAENEIKTIESVQRSINKTSVQSFVLAHTRKIDKRWYVSPHFVVLVGPPKELLYVKTSCQVKFSTGTIKSCDSGDVIIKNKGDGKQLVAVKPNVNTVKKITGNTCYDEFFG